MDKTGHADEGPERAGTPQERGQEGWIPGSALEQPGLYLYKDEGDAVRLVEVTYDLGYVYPIGRPGRAGAIARFRGRFSLAQPFPVL